LGIIFHLVFRKVQYLVIMFFGCAADKNEDDEDCCKVFYFRFLWLITAKTGRMFGFSERIKKKDGLINRLLT